MTQVTDHTRTDHAGSEREPVAAPLDTRDWLRQRIARPWAAGIGAAWWSLYLIAAAIEPSTHHPEPSFAVLLTYALFAGMLVTAAGLLALRRWAFVGSLATAGFFSALVIACPTTGHHTIGAWWFVQLACAAALVVGSVVALRRA
jgi:hypothetical protein